MYYYPADNIRRMTGHAASVDDLKQLTYMAYRFSSKVQAVDTVSSLHDQCTIIDMFLIFCDRYVHTTLGIGFWWKWILCYRQTIL